MRQLSRPMADLALAQLGLAADLAVAVAQATFRRTHRVVFAGKWVGDHSTDLAGTPAGRAIGLGDELDVARAPANLAPPTSDDNLTLPAAVASRTMQVRVGDVDVPGATAGVALVVVHQSDLSAAGNSPDR